MRLPFPGFFTFPDLAPLLTRLNHRGSDTPVSTFYQTLLTRSHETCRFWWALFVSTNVSARTPYVHIGSSPPTQCSVTTWTHWGGIQEALGKVSMWFNHDEQGFQASWVCTDCRRSAQGYYWSHLRYWWELSVKYYQSYVGFWQLTALVEPLAVENCYKHTCK